MTGLFSLEHRVDWMNGNKKLAQWFTWIVKTCTLTPLTGWCLLLVQDSRRRWIIWRFEKLQLLFVVIPASTSLNKYGNISLETMMMINSHWRLASNTHSMLFLNHFFLKLKKVQARNRTCCVFKIPDPDSSSWWFRDSLGYTHPLHILSPRTPVSQETRSSSDHQNVKSRRETRESKINFNPTKFEEAIKSLSNQIDGVLAAAWLRQLLGGSAYRSYVGFTTLSTKIIPALASVNRSTYKMVAKIRAVVMQAKVHYCIGLIAVTTITKEVTFINY